MEQRPTSRTLMTSIIRGKPLMITRIMIHETKGMNRAQRREQGYTLPSINKPYEKEKNHEQ